MNTARTLPLSSDYSSIDDTSQTVR